MLSKSLSFEATVLETDVSSFVELASSKAIGASLIGLTVIVKLAVSQSPLGSHTLYVTTVEPLKFNAGINV